MQIFVQGIQRVRIREIAQAQPFVKARFDPAPVALDVGDEVEALEREVRELGTKALALARPDASDIDLSQLTGGEEDRLRWLYILASLMGLEMAKAQELLSADNLSKALALMLEYLQHEVRILELRQDIASKVQTELTKQQRDALLRHQMRAIQEELGRRQEGAESSSASASRRRTFPRRRERRRTGS
jgi:ATP-dependent Lon protease